MKLNQVTVGCLDYDSSVAFYQTLGLIQIVVAPPGYARFETPTGETFSIHQVAAIGDPTTVIYFEVERLDEKVRELEKVGIVFESQPADQSWGWREARLRDPAGNSICLFFGNDNRRFPPWRITNQPTEKGNCK